MAASRGFGAVFASFEPLSMTWPQYNYYDQYEEMTTILGSEFSYQGTQFGGIVPKFLSAFGFGL